MPPTLSSFSPSKPFRVARWARCALLAVPVGMGLGLGCGSKSSQFTGGAGGTSTGSTSPTTGTTGTGGNPFAGTSAATTTSGGPGGGPGACQTLTPTTGPNQWAMKNSEMSGVQAAQAVATDFSDNVIVAGAAGRSTSVTFGSLPAVAASGDANNAFVAKLGPSGTPIWAQGFVATGSATSNGVIGSGALAVTSDTSGNVWMGGYFDGTLAMSGQTITSQPADHVFPNAFVAELEPTMGNVTSLMRFGNPSTDPANGGGGAQVQGLATFTTPTGDVIAIGGWFETQLDLTIYPGGTMLSAETGVNNQHAGFLVVQRVADESIVFSAQFGDGSGATGAEVNGVAFDASGDVLVTGDTSEPITFPSGTALTPAGSQAAFAGKIKGDGSATVWANVYGDTTASGASITSDASGDVFVAGQHTDMIDFGGGPLTATAGSNAFVAKLDTNGKYVWAHTYGVKGEHAATGIGVDSMGHAVVTGQFTGTMDFGTTLITGNMLTNEVFLAKLDTQGCQIWSQAIAATGDDASAGLAIDSTGDAVIAGHLSSASMAGGTATFGTTMLTVAEGTGGAITQNVFIAKFGP